MHVADIVVTRVLSGRKYYGQATVTMVDDGGAPVSGATVGGLLSGDGTEALSGVTGTDGSVTLRSARKYYGTNEFCFEVTDVGGTLAYVASANVVTMACESGDVFRRNETAQTGIWGVNPNPFNPVTVVDFHMARGGQASVRIYDMSGRLVETLYDGFLGAGLRSLTWDASSQASGIYFCEFQVGDLVETRKLTLLK